jgi:hypothetical protein
MKKKILFHLLNSGTLIIEDFVKRGSLTAQEMNDLEVMVACPYVPSQEEYIVHLTNAGFSNIQAIDLRY